jgi:hypothetical protein
MRRAQLFAVGVSVLCLACSGTGSGDEDRTPDSSQAGAAVVPDTARPIPPAPEKGVNKPTSVRRSTTGARADSIIGRDSAIEWPKGGKPGRALPIAKRN